MGNYIEIDPEADYPSLRPADMHWLADDEAGWAEGQVDGSESSDVAAVLRTLARRLADERRKSVGQIDVMRMGMMQQQAYHRLLGKVFIHHKDCEDCVEMMRTILTMIAQNIEHIEQLMPEDERVKVPGEAPGGAA
jgi:predicted nuclease with TOPRIM domain